MKATLPCRISVDRENEAGFFVLALNPEALPR